MRNPLDQLTAQKAKIYRLLPINFGTSEGAEIAIMEGISKRNFQYWIKDERLFKRIGVGSYERRYKGN